MCLYKRLIINPKYKRNQKNGGNVPHLHDKRIQYVPIGCGNCIECRKQKAREWQVRLQEDIKTHTNGIFVALTFSNESIKYLLEQHIQRKNKISKQLETIQIKTLYGYEKDNAIATKAVELFRERYRKANKQPLRHWLCTELGHKGTENIHLHGIIWINDHRDIRKYWGTGQPTKDAVGKETCNGGFIWDGYTKNGIRINYVNNQTIGYCIKYINKTDQRNKEYKPIILTSPGIGKNYKGHHNKFKGTDTDETYRLDNGHKIALPIYLRNKIYSEEEREQLWLQRLDKNEVWIMGEKLPATETKQIDQLLKWYRRVNTELGYGNLPNANRKDYENKRRELLIMTRAKKASGGV